MSNFPLFIDLSDKNVLVIGGGKVASRKVKVLLSFTDRITVVDPKPHPEILQLIKQKGLKLKRRKFLTQDLKSADLVIVAVNNLSLQKRVFSLCKKKKIPCNSVDSPRFCTFIFPSIVKKGDLVVGVSTGGRAPSVSAKVRKIIENCLPEDIDAILEEIARIRDKLPKGEKRQKFLKELTDELLSPAPEDDVRSGRKPDNCS